MYLLRLAIKSILREKWINILTAITIGFALLILSITVFTLYNIELVSKKLPEKFTIMVYLKDGLSRDEIDSSKELMEREKLVKSVVYISKEEAFKELKESLKGSGYILEGLDENPLSPSFEIRIKKGLFSMEAVEELIKKLESKPQVDAVDYGKGFLDFVQSFKNAMRMVGIFFATLIFLAIIFVIYSTVKILFYRRNDEIETYKLLGATAGFIRAPFLIEGGVIGLLGGIFGIIESYAFYYVLFNLGSDIPLLGYMSFPVHIFGVLPVVGLLLGLFGTVFALGRVKF
ncbi:MAG: permease-like cell division protein FtsX [Thermodesulfovibrionales bacterium]